MIDRRKLAAHILPMALFIALLALNSALSKVGGAFWLNSAQYWIYPIQTLLCGGLLFWFRREYSLTLPRCAGFGLLIGVIVFILWISPQTFLGFTPRTEGFDPTVFGSQPSLYWATVILRFVRLVVVVPFMEEIFWRGFLLRYVISEKFYDVPVGTFSWPSFLVVAVAFALAHSTADWPAAIATGMLYNVVAYRTKSLSTCVLTHAVTNLLLGLWIMKTGQWGFW